MRRAASGERIRMTVLPMIEQNKSLIAALIAAGLSKSRGV
jgi:hypothetical protein